MPLIDERGRLFGRVNVIDAAVGLLVLGLIPLAYGAYILFRQPEPRITSVEPAQVLPTTTQVRIHGEDLRPFMRVSFNELQGVTFALLTPQLAEVRIPELRAGTYDVVLYDVAREVSRLPGALTVQAAPLPTAAANVLVAGSFVALDDASAGLVQKGRELTALANTRASIVELGQAQRDTRAILSGEVTVQVPLNGGRRVPALLRAICTVVDQRCSVGGVGLEPGNVLSLFTEDGRALRFVVDEALPDGATREADVLVRFLIAGEATPVVRAGDRDRGSVLLGQRLATLASVVGPRRVSGNTSWNAAVAGVVGRNLTLNIADGASVIDATLRAVLDETADGLSYRGRAVKSGMPLVFETDSYVLRGWIQRVEPRPRAATDQ